MRRETESKVKKTYVEIYEDEIKAPKGTHFIKAETINHGAGIAYQLVRYTDEDNNYCIEQFPESPEARENKKQVISKFDEFFPIVEIEQISLNDKFLDFETKNELAKRIKESIIEAKEIGMKNFRKAAMDPILIAGDGGLINIGYCPGKIPACCYPGAIFYKNAEWWILNARKYMPEKRSRIINDLEKDVWLGTIIKYLVEKKGYEVQKAWYEVCVDSKEIGLYFDSENSENITAKTDYLEVTGSRKLGQWYDLGNILKVVRNRKAYVLEAYPNGIAKFGSEYFYYGGNGGFYGRESPLAERIDGEGCSKRCVGEIVMDV